MDIFNQYFCKDMIITWPNGMKIKCNAFHGMAESGEDDIEYEGGFYTLVKDVEILERGKDNSISEFSSFESILICIKNIPDKIELLDGTVLWQRKKLMNG